MKKVLLVVCVVLLSICLNVNARSIDDVVVAETTKYYKTITNLGIGVLNSEYNLNNMPGVNNSSVTYEITEEEYENGNDGTMTLSVSDGYVETTYKRLTSTIVQAGNIYEYQANMHWKNMPTVRSYDIMAIGYPASVQGGTPTFEYHYCYSLNNCYYSTLYNWHYDGTNGQGAVFSLVTGSLYSMDAYMEFYVYKNTTSTIITQYADADYAHAVKNVTLNNAKKFSVHFGGILHDASMISSYDDIPVAEAIWQGTW